MRDTGIIRRIDELGRIVVPKEIRKTIRIREGDPLEIFMDDGEIVLKKYSPLKNVLEIASSVCDSIYEQTERIAVVTDNDEIVCFSKNKNKDLIGGKISASLGKIIKDRKSVILVKKDGGEIIDIVNNADLKVESQIIIPIIANGDVFGSLIVYSLKEDDKISEDDISLCRLSVNIISKYFE